MSLYSCMSVFLVRSNGVQGVYFFFSIISNNCFNFINSIIQVNDIAASQKLVNLEIIIKQLDKNGYMGSDTDTDTDTTVLVC